MSNTGTYQNGQTAQQFKCELVVSGESLYLYMQDGSKHLLIWDLRTINSCHLNGSQVIIKNWGYPHETLVCSGEIAREVYATWSQNNLVRKAEGLMFKKNHFLILTLCAAFLAICVFAYFWLLPWVGEHSAALVPVGVEIEMGEQLDAMITQGSVVNDSATYYAGLFTKELNLDTDYPLNVRVIQSDEINAFALPGGRIVIYSGILGKMDTYEELVALLGHEITHVTHRHSLRSILRTTASSLLIATLFGDVSGISAAVLEQADQFKQLDYSRELETEADDHGLALMVQNKINPQGMVKLLELLKTEAVEMPAMMKYLSTHPDTQARIDNVKANPFRTMWFDSNTKMQKLFDGIKRNL